MNVANPATIPLASAGVAILATAAYIRRARHRAVASREQVFVAASMATWVLAYALETASESLLAKLFWHRVSWLGIAFTPIAAVLFALSFARRSPPRWAVVLFALIPSCSAALALVGDPMHWLETQATLVSYGAYSMRRADGQWGFVVFMVHGYLCIIGATSIYAALWIAGSPLYRKQARWLLLGTIAPLICNIVYNAGHAPVHELDLTPLAFSVTFLAWTWALRRDGFLDLVPIVNDHVVAAMSDPVIVLDRDDRVLEMNPAARRTFGIASQSSESGRSADSVLAAWPDLIAAIRVGTSRDVRVDASRFEVKLSDIGNGIGRVVLLRDVTERALAEVAREAALRDAEKTSQMRSEFIARMSHEVRTPLHGVVGATDLLRESLANDPRKQLVDIADASARGLLEVVDDILDFERLDAGGLALVEEDFSIAAVVGDVATMMRAVAARKNLSLAVDDDGVEYEWLRGDPRRIRQIVTNLVGNAFKFTEHGGVRIDLATTRNTPDEIALRLVVSDTGPGFAEDAIERAFEPFVQLEKTETRRHDGAGLGLAITRRLARAMGGEVTLANRASGGASATFVGQFAEGAARVVRAPTRRAMSSRTAARVLVCENNPVSRLIVARMLERLGYEFRTVDSGAEVLPAIDAFEPTIVLLDLHLPGTSGVDVATRIRATRGGELPLFAFTADARASMRRECLRAGMDGVLLKPATMRQLDDVIVRHGSGPAINDGAEVPEAFSLGGDVLSLFAETVANEVTELRRAYDRKDDAEMRRIAHGIAGSSAFVGRHEVAVACRALLDAPSVHEPLVTQIESSSFAAISAHRGAA